MLSCPVSDLVDYSSYRRLFLFPQRESLLRRLRSSFNRAALLIRLTDLIAAAGNGRDSGTKTQRGVGLRPTDWRTEDPQEKGDRGRGSQAAGAMLGDAVAERTLEQGDPGQAAGRRRRGRVNSQPSLGRA